MPLKGSGYFWSGLAEGLRSNVNPQKSLWEMALLEHKYNKMWDYKQKELSERSKFQKDILKMKQDFQKEFLIPLQQRNLDIKAYQAWLDEIKTQRDVERNLNDLLKAQTEISKILINSDAIDEEIAKGLGIDDISKAKTVLRETLEKVNDKIKNYINSEKTSESEKPVGEKTTQKTIIRQVPNVVNNVIKNKKVENQPPEI